VFKTILGISQLQRQIRGTRRLQGLGIRTPEVVDQGWWRTPSPALPQPPVGGREFRTTLQSGGYRFARPTLRLSYVPGEDAFDLWHVVEPDRERLIPAAGQVGEMVRIMASSRTLNRDFKLNNLILAKGEDGPEVWVIDTVGVRRCRNRIRATFRMLERLIIQATPELLTERPWAWWPVMRAALKGMTKRERGEVFRRLREHLRR